MVNLAYKARRTRAGSVTSPQTSPNAPSTAIPTTRNGSSNSHTKGYNTSATSARGQQKNNRTNHKRSFTTRFLRSQCNTNKGKQLFQSATM